MIVLITVSEKPARRTWTTPEKEAVERHFKRHIYLGRVPSKVEVQECKDAEPALRGRMWSLVKDYVRNRGVAEAKKKR